MSFNPKEINTDSTFNPKNWKEKEKETFPFEPKTCHRAEELFTRYFMELGQQATKKNLVLLMRKHWEEKLLTDDEFQLLLGLAVVLNKESIERNGYKITKKENWFN